MSRLLCLGMGYCARALAERLHAKGWRIAGTSRSADGLARIEQAGWIGYPFTGDAIGPALAGELAAATHLLVSIPPEASGDPALSAGIGAHIRNLSWVGYLSTVGVYGDRGGEWVEETDQPRPTSERSVRRLAAEQAWQNLGAAKGIPVHVFRLAGIYGPGRNVLLNLLAGTAKRIVKPGQVFNRIHVADIASVLEASIARPRAGAIYNVSDQEPAPPEDVVTFAAALLGMEPPPILTFEAARPGLSPMALSFYAENKRVRSALLACELGVRLAYPTFREGLAALLPAVQAPFR